MQNLDRFKFKGLYKNALYECFSFCDEFVKLVIDGNIVKVLRNEVLLMQCTGLKDKNGKLIFEGDLIKCVSANLVDNIGWSPVKKVYKIEWQQYICGFRAVSKDNLILDYQMSAECEVIGNVYENKDLAKQYDLI